MSVKFKDLDTCSPKFHESKNGKKRIRKMLNDIQTKLHILILCYYN